MEFAQNAFPPPDLRFWQDFHWLTGRYNLCSLADFRFNEILLSHTDFYYCVTTQSPISACESDRDCRMLGKH